MAKIEVGMLVEIIDGKSNRDDLYLYVGKISKTVRTEIWRGYVVWVLEGMKERFHENFLLPLNPQKINPDIEETKEKGCGDWPFLKELLFNTEKKNEKV